MHAKVIIMKMTEKQEENPTSMKEGERGPFLSQCLKEAAESGRGNCFLGCRSSGWTGPHLGRWHGKVLSETSVTKATVSLETKME